MTKYTPTKTGPKTFGEKELPCRKHGTTTYTATTCGETRTYCAHCGLGA